MNNSKFTARRFLANVREAMENAHLLDKEIQWKSKYDPPKLVPDLRDWKVDEEEFKQFETVIDFLRLTLFGVCDRSRLVQFELVDRTRNQVVLPSFPIPKTPFGTAEREIVEALDLAQANARDAACLSDNLQKTLTRRLQDRYKREDRLAKAKGCETCCGMGWTRNEEAFKALEHYDRNRARTELGGYARVFCGCQKDNDDN